jgi:hypothetical protein
MTAADDLTRASAGLVRVCDAAARLPVPPGPAVAHLFRDPVTLLADIYAAGTEAAPARSATADGRAARRSARPPVAVAPDHHERGDLAHDDGPRWEPDHEAVAAFSRAGTSWPGIHAEPGARGRPALRDDGDGAAPPLLAGIAPSAWAARTDVAGIVDGLTSDRPARHHDAAAGARPARQDHAAAGARRARPRDAAGTGELGVRPAHRADLAGPREAAHGDQPPGDPAPLVSSEGAALREPAALGRPVRRTRLATGARDLSSALAAEAQLAPAPPAFPPVDAPASDRLDGMPELMERLTAELEFDFLRLYGTSELRR